MAKIEATKMWPSSALNMPKLRLNLGWRRLAPMEKSFGSIFREIRTSPKRRAGSRAQMFFHLFACQLASLASPMRPDMEHELHNLWSQRASEMAPAHLLGGHARMRVLRASVYFLLLLLLVLPLPVGSLCGGAQP